MAHLPTGEQYIAHAALACVLLVLLVTALLALTRWFRANASRVSAEIARHAEQLGSSPALQELRARHPQTWKFILRRFEPGEYLGLHLTVGMTISIGALWLFGYITENVIHHPSLMHFDVMLLQWFHGHATKSGINIFAAISFLGSPVILTLLGTSIAVSFAVKRAWILFAGWIAALVGAGVLDKFLKQAVQRPRPPYAIAVLHINSFSFPSGHAMASLIAYGMTAYVATILCAQRRSLRIAIAFGATVLILFIGVSRLYLGVHYFSDVIAGYAAGTVWLSVCVTGIEIARRQPTIQV